MDGLIRVRYLGGNQCAEVIPDVAASLIANGIAEEIKEDGKPAPVVPVVHTATAPVHHQQAAALPRAGFMRGPITNARRIPARAGR